MKFICEQKILMKALNTVSKAVTVRTTIPILKGILLDVKENGKLILAASDLDLSIEKSIDVNVEKAGSTVVSAKLFSDIIRKLPNENITIELDESGKVIIKTLNSEFNIVGQNTEEFPSIGELEDNNNDKLSFDRDILKDMIRKTYFSSSVDESKGIIVGVLFEVKKDKLTMVSLDGFRMAIARENMTSSEDREIVISAKILGEINKILAESEDEDTVDLILSDKKAVMLMGQTRIVMRLMDGEFIKYNDIIPKENETKIVVNKGTLLESIERASLLAKEGKNNLIKCSITENLLTITSTSEEGNVKEEIIIEKTGNNIDIGFNSKYILDALKAIDEENIAMEFNKNVNPCLIKPMSGERFEYLVLPVRIPTN